MTMIERVALALEAVASYEPCTSDSYERMARAAISAMREPTLAMLLPIEGGALGLAGVLEDWQKMIDAALEG